MIELTADIVSAYVSKNPTPISELTKVISAVHAALNDLAAGGAAKPAEVPQEPAVSIKKSVTNDYIICLEDGKKFKSLKRHLKSAYGLTPEDYRAKWKLPSDYPMVAPAYAERRSALAKSMGLGQQRKQAAETKRAKN